MKSKTGVVAAALLSIAGLAHAQVDQVKVWAAACANCHGTNGHAQPGMEALAGKDRDDMVQKLLDFKNGRKPATIMHQLAKGYTDDELKAIAAYFAAQKK
ncbi:c-type cytochrome [Tepidimonas sp.]|uniref:c-type cytochrome n=1 Tax=Tepidimonas sp. TaxID=2002775 RepID=UPI002FE27FB0